MHVYMAVRAAVLGGLARMRSDCSPWVEKVSEQLRRDVVQGKDVNLAAFLNRALTNQVFIEVFIIYKNIMTGPILIAVPS